MVMLVRSSVSDACQWRLLIDELNAEFHVRAVNLFGYGKTNLSQHVIERRVCRPRAERSGTALVATILW